MAMPTDIELTLSVRRIITRVYGISIYNNKKLTVYISFNKIQRMKLKLMEIEGKKIIS